MLPSLNFPGDFQIVSRLGHGSYGKLFAYESSSGLRCAGKHQSVSRYSKMEVDALRNINSERIVAFFGEFFREEYGCMKHVIFLEICDIDLKTYIGRISPEYIQTDVSFRSFAAQLIEGVLAIHSAGFIHCDIKPSNILLKGNQLKICDFGLACRAKNSPNIAVGTFGFQGPEAFVGGFISQKYDIWAVGCVLYFIATCGDNPFDDGKDINFRSYMRKIGYIIGFSPKMAPLASKYSFVFYSGEYKPFGFGFLQEIIGYCNWELIWMCLRSDPDDRPSSSDLYNHETFNFYFDAGFIPDPVNNFSMSKKIVYGS